MIYLDNSATTKQDPNVTKLMLRIMEDEFGNPSSLYSIGLNAQNTVTDARRKVAETIGVGATDIFFTSGGTEGDNTAILGVARARRHAGKRVITTAVEHPAVLEACRRLESEGFEVVYLQVSDSCEPDMNAFREALSHDTILVTMMAVNNETGAITDIKTAAEAAHEKDIIFHTDAVQAYGKISLSGCGADLMTISAHKIHGPKGVGALYVKSGINLPPLLVGGGQESGKRSGTENVPGIAGFGEAALIADEELKGGLRSMKAARNYLCKGICDRITDIRVNSPENGVPSVLNVSFRGVKGEVLLHILEEDEIYVSTGSACSSRKKGRSHVLQAMGIDDEAIDGAIRFSFSRCNTIQEMDFVLDKLEKAVKNFRSINRYRR